MSFTGLALALSFAVAPVFASADLSALKWEKRVLLIFGDADEVRYAEQQKLLRAQSDGLAERDMIVLGVTGQIVSTLFGDTSGFDVDAVRNTAGEIGTNSFHVVLIGKDGGVKQRWSTPVSSKALFAIIDAMPMRANEIRR